MDYTEIIKRICEKTKSDEVWWLNVYRSGDNKNGVPNEACVHLLRGFLTSPDTLKAVFTQQRKTWVEPITYTFDGKIIKRPGFYRRAHYKKGKDWQHHAYQLVPLDIPEILSYYAKELGIERR